MARNSHPESDLQRAILADLRDQGFIGVAVPNGAHLAGNRVQRSITMNNMKRDGLMPGFPDLLVYGKQGQIGHIEVKYRKRPLHPNQIQVAEWLQSLGHKWALCRSTDDAKAALTEWGWL